MYFYAMLAAALAIVIMGKAMSLLITIATLFCAFVFAVAALRYIADVYGEAYEEPKLLKNFRLPTIGPKQ